MSKEIENKLYTTQDVAGFINDGKILALAGTEKLLSELPAGNWIGGTIPYFMNTDTCMFNNEMIFVNDLTDFVEDYSINVYDETNIENITNDSFPNGFTLLIVPAFQPVHKEFALKAPQIKDIYMNPVIGWITGTELNSQDNKPKTFSGKETQDFTDKAIALHIKIADEKVAILDIVNIFEEKTNSVEIQFFENGFSASECLINGVKTSLIQFIKEKSIDIKLPIIADYSGAKINISFKEIDIENNTVSFYAPVFKDVVYKLAQPLDSYVSSFESKVPNVNGRIAFSSNCILNYLYGELEGKKIKGINGPITFGEIGYILLNQTMTYLVIE